MRLLSSHLRSRCYSGQRRSGSCDGNLHCDSFIDSGPDHVSNRCASEVVKESSAKARFLAGGCPYFADLN